MAKTEQSELTPAATVARILARLAAEFPLSGLVSSFSGAVSKEFATTRRHITSISFPDRQISGAHDEVLGQLLGVISDGAAAKHQAVIGEAQVEIMNAAAELALDVVFKLRDFFGAAGVLSGN